MMSSESDKNTENTLIISEDDASSFTLKNIIYFLKRAFFRIVIYASVCAIIAAVSLTIYYFSFIKSSGYAAARIEFDYPGIEKGLDLLGQELNVDFIRSDFILNRAIVNLNIDLDTANLRKSISVNPVVPGDILNRLDYINKLIEQDPANYSLLEEVKYYPSKFIIEVENSKLNENQAKAVLNELIKQYKEYFFAKLYSLNIYTFSLLDFESVSNYDFVEQIEIYEIQLDLAKIYFDMLTKNINVFSDYNTALSLSELVAKTSIIKNYDIKAIKDLVVLGNITKLTYGNFRKLMEERIWIAESEIRTANAAISAVNQILSDYEREQIVVLPSVSGGQAMEINGASEFYDTMLAELVKLKTKMAEKNESIDYIKYQLKKIENYDDSDTSPQSDIKTVELLLGSLNIKYNNLIEKAASTIKDYYNENYMNNAIRLEIPATFIPYALTVFEISIILFFSALAGTIAAMLHTGIVLYKSKHK